MKNNKELIAMLHAAKNNSKKINAQVMNKNLRIYPAYSKCKKCNGTLYLENGNPCTCLDKYTLDLKLKFANVGMRYKNVTLDFYIDNLPAAKVIIDNKMFGIDEYVSYIDLYVKTFRNRLNDGRGFVICGKTGCGKTGALCYIIREILSKGYTAYYIDTNELLETILLTYNDSADMFDKRTALKKIEDLKNVDLLVLDDFGSEYSKSSEWLYNIFLKLIKTRYSRNKPTLMSTNFKSDNLMMKFDKEMSERLSSVFSETFDMIDLKGEVDIRCIRGKKSLITKMRKEV